MIVIKYNEWLIVQPDLQGKVYELCDDEFNKIKLINKKEAIRLISENNLQVVCKNKYGTIWK